LGAQPQRFPQRDHHRQRRHRLPATRWDEQVQTTLPDGHPYGRRIGRQATQRLRQPVADRVLYLPLLHDDANRSGHADDEGRRGHLSDGLKTRLRHLPAGEAARQGANHHHHQEDGGGIVDV